MKKSLLRFYLLLSLLSLGAQKTHGQTLLELFAALPISYTPEFTEADKATAIEHIDVDHLLGDSSESFYATLRLADFSLQVDLSDSGPGMFIYQLKRFFKSDGSQVVLLVKMGASRGKVDILELYQLAYEAGRFREIKEDLGLSRKLDPRLFFKESLPDSINFLQLDLNPEYLFDTGIENTIAYRLEPWDLFLEAYLLRKEVRLVWDGERFKCSSS
jgi:hypothetical protein